MQAEDEGHSIGHHQADGDADDRRISTPASWSTSRGVGRCALETVVDGPTDLGCQRRLVDLPLAPEIGMAPAWS